MPLIILAKNQRSNARKILQLIVLEMLYLCNNASLNPHVSTTTTQSAVNR